VAAIISEDWGEIISGGWAPSSRSAGRHHPGTGGAIIPHCRATSPGICTHDCHLHGLATLDRLKIRTVDEALTLFSNAIELDPRFAKAYALAAYCRAVRLASPGHIADREEEQAEAERLARPPRTCSGEPTAGASFGMFTHTAYLLSARIFSCALHQLRSTSHMTPAAIMILHSLSSGVRSSSAIVIM
jgi:hypothetical protein